MVPPDKSITHRALMLASIAEGPSNIRNWLASRDCVSTVRCLEQLGTSFHGDAEGNLTVHPGEWTSPRRPLDCGNSGTTMRLLAGLIAGRPIRATLIGDSSLSARPMGRIAEPLVQMGAHVSGATAPLMIEGSTLKGIHHISPIASAQVKSCLLFAGLTAGGKTSVTEPFQSRNHTEQMLNGLGVDVEIANSGRKTAVSGPVALKGFEASVPGDISSAAFWLVAGLLVPKSELCLRNVGINPTRTGCLDVLAQIGASIEVEPLSADLGEPRADLQVRSANKLAPFVIDAPLVPRLIDEIPILAVLATQCEGITEIRDADELRRKESDRLEAITENLTRMGAEVDLLPDGMLIKGPVSLKGASIDSRSDHRIALAFCIAALVAEGETTISDWQSTKTSYPHFEADLKCLM